MIQASSERIIPDTILQADVPASAALRLHIDRYRFAGEHLQNGSVLDIACGVGYGSHLMLQEFANKITSITAVDRDPTAIDYARTRYPDPRISFLQTDAANFAVPQRFSNIVSLETIEHLPDPVMFIKQMALLLEPGGHFIVSAPITPSVDANPFHLHDFTKRSLERIFAEQGFSMINRLIQVQPFSMGEILARKEKGSEHLRSGMLKFYLQHPSKIWLRFRSLVVDGLTNKYIVAVFRKAKTAT